jgi:repressor LexA
MSAAEKQERILNFIQDFMDDRGYAPTVSEIQKACAISSKSVVEYRLRALEREGKIRRDAEVARGLEIAGMGRRAWSIPLLGTIAAGEPVPVPTEDTWHTTPQDDVVDVPADLVDSPDQVFALTVKGTSMIDALVDDGDIVVLRATNAAEDGEMVAAWLSDRQEATLKRLYHEQGRIRLQPATQGMSAIYTALDKLVVQGKVIGVIRKL